MRSFPLIACLTILTCVARAQEQERKLIDRLLRPDMSLVNSAQDKKFIPAQQSAFEQRVDSKVFYPGRQHSTKRFWGIRDFFTRTIIARKSSQGALVVINGGENRYSETHFATHKSSFAAAARDAKKKVSTGEYPESQRPFLAKGSRQKILSRQNHSMTIEEVRELLNKPE